MKAKTLIVMATCMAIGLCASGCQNSMTQTAVAQEDVVHIQIAYENNPGEPLDLACQRWKELLEEQSGGEIQVELYPSSQLGSKSDIVNQEIAGDSVITLANGAFYADLGVSDFSVTFAPYLFRSWEDIEKLAESDWWAEQEEKLRETTGLVIVGSNWHYGVRNTITKEPVQSPEDMKGLKIRVPGNQLQVDSMGALGAAGTPMSLGDVYTALQQGTIDGLENPIAVIENGKYQEVAKYLCEDAHIYDLTTWCCGDEFFSSLTEEQQELLMKTCEEAGVYNNEILDSETSKALQKLEEAGVTVYTVDNPDEWLAASQSFYDAAEEKYGWSDGLVDTVKNIIGQ